MEGIYAYVPGMPASLTVHTFEILSALDATAEALSEIVDDSAHARRREGLANAVRVLAKMLQQCYAGDTVVRKPVRKRRAPGPPHPRKSKPAPRCANVVSLVHPPAA